MLAIQIRQREAAGCLRGNVKVQHLARDTYITFIMCIGIILHFIINRSLNCLMCKLNFTLGALSIGKSTTCKGLGFATEVLGYVPVDESGLLYSLQGIPGGEIGGCRFCGVKL